MSQPDFKVVCPYCFETIWMEFFQEEGDDQEMVVDCEVCCKPILYRVHFDQDGKGHVRTERAQ